MDCYCNICTELMYNPLILNPCLHQICEDCYQRLQKKVCPYCRKNIHYSTKFVGLANYVKLNYGSKSVLSPPTFEITKPLSLETNQRKAIEDLLKKMSENEIRELNNWIANRFSVDNKIFLK